MLFINTRLVVAGAGMTWRESRPSDSNLSPSRPMTAIEPSQSDYHIPVLLPEVLRLIAPEKGKILVDGTLGGGGHTEALLKAGANVVGIDQDEQALAYASERLEVYTDRFRALKGNFSSMSQLLAEAGYEQVDGILVDIGVSSWQLDEAERGFSFGKDGPLDMRMDRSSGKTAADLINTASEQELKTIFFEYGEERASNKIARRIVERREQKPFVTTLDLADFIASIIPRGGKSHPATRIFQALRIAVNDELGVLKQLLKQAASMLRPGGRFAVITFHSLEDRLVKQFFKNASEPTIDRKEWPEPRPNPDYCYKLITRRPVTAGDDELKINRRSRSAKLRVVEKITLPNK